jgi:hypothetical protein
MFRHFVVAAAVDRKFRLAEMLVVCLKENISFI